MNGGFFFFILQQLKTTRYINTSQQITSIIQPTVEHHNRGKKKNRLGQTKN